MRLRPLAGALLAGAYLARVGMRERRLEPRPRHAAWLLAAGAVLFAGGYAIFLATKNAMNTPSGIGNRVAIAAAVGVALGWAGVAWGLATLARSQRGRAAAFAVMIAGLFGAAVFVNVSLARFWADAYRAERAVLAEIRRLIPAHPGPISLLLDGVCPYVGPAIVFESNWDLAGALAVVYGPPMMRADVVTPYLTVGDTAVTTSIYHGDITAHYGYRDMVLVDVARGRRVPLADAAAARRHFAAFNPDRSGGCPPGAAGQGVAVF